MKKIIQVFFLTVVFLTSCGKSTPVVVETPTKVTEKKTPGVTPTSAAMTNIKVGDSALKGVKILVWHPWYGGESNLFASMVKDFNESNQWGIEVRAESQVNFTNMYENVTASLSTTEKPDLVIALPEHALEWNANGVVTDLAPYIQDPLYGMDTKDIPALFLQQDQNGEKQIALPAQRNARFLLWNKTWAGELGFASAPSSPEGFRKQACSAQQSMLKDASPQNDSMGGWLVDTEPMTAYAWMLAFGGGVLEGNDYRFLTPKNIEALTFLRELSEKTCAWQADASVDAATAFTTREALFVTASLEDLPGIARGFASAGSRDEWKVIPFPGTDAGAVVVYGSSYVILNSSEEKKLAAWLFVRWLLENKQDARFVEASHLFPVRSSTVDLLGDYKKTHPQWVQAIDLLPVGEIQPQLASWRQVKTMISDGFAHMYRVNIPSGQVAAILAQMESIARDLSAH